ncbi:MAG: hypothetical protein AAB470_01370 [Patescibacteria group bacterium]
MASQLKVSPEFAQNGFQQIFDRIKKTRPWHRNLMDLAVRYPKELRTPKENLEIAVITGRRRLVLNQQAKNCSVSFAKEGQKVAVSINHCPRARDRN